MPLQKVLILLILGWLLFCFFFRNQIDYYEDWGLKLGPQYRHKIPPFSERNLLLPTPDYEVSDPPDSLFADTLLQSKGVYRHLNEPNVTSYTAGTQYKSGECLDGDIGDNYQGTYCKRSQSKCPSKTLCTKPYQYFYVKNRVGDPIYSSCPIKIPTQPCKNVRVKLTYSPTHPILDI